MTHVQVDAELWNEFHRLVNMSSRELSEWLRTDSADPEDEELPDKAGTPTGQHVLRILRKRKTDLDESDIAVMRGVVDQVQAELTQGANAEEAEEAEPQGGSPEWRHRLMSLGHDPLKPS